MAAKQALDRILQLQGQLDLEVPDSVFFRYAQVLERAELYDEAMQFVMRYLTLAERDGAHYREALRLLNSAEEAKAAAEAAIAGMEFVPVPAGSFRIRSKHK